MPEREGKAGINGKGIMSDTGKEARTRTISWEDPRALPEAGRRLSSLEYLQKIVASDGQAKDE